MDDRHINEKVYREVAEKLGTSTSEIRTVMSHVADTIRDVIITDNPDVSVKLDYIGNIFSDKERRKIITAKKELKNGRLTSNS